MKYVLLAGFVLALGACDRNPFSGTKGSCGVFDPPARQLKSNDTYTQSWLDWQMDKAVHPDKGCNWARPRTDASPGELHPKEKWGS